MSAEYLSQSLFPGTLSEALWCPYLPDPNSPTFFFFFFLDLPAAYGVQIRVAVVTNAKAATLDPQPTVPGQGLNLHPSAAETPQQELPSSLTVSIPSPKHEHPSPISS